MAGLRGEVGWIPYRERDEREGKLEAERQADDVRFR